MYDYLMGRPKSASAEKARDTPAADSAPETARVDAVTKIAALGVVVISVFFIYPVLRELASDLVWGEEECAAVLSLELFWLRIGKVFVVALVGTNALITIMYRHVKKRLLELILFFYLFMYASLCLILTGCRMQIENK